MKRIPFVLRLRVKKTIEHLTGVVFQAPRAGVNGRAPGLFSEYGTGMAASPPWDRRVALSSVDPDWGRLGGIVCFWALEWCVFARSGG